MKIAVVVGTRPEIIKTYPVIQELRSRNVDFFIIHSNQHYSPEMDAIFFKELGLPAPKYNLNVGSSQHGNQTGNILIKIEPILTREAPDVLLVQGDTNTVAAAALAASKLGIKIGHIEAGLRSYDRKMPEEVNRVIVDHISDYLFSVTSVQSQILAHEGIGSDKIFEVGNTIVDAVRTMGANLAQPDLFTQLKLEKNKYFLLTAHRASNVDDEHSLRCLLLSLGKVAKKFQFPIIFPCHPRTSARIKEFSLTVSEGIKILDPLGYNDFLYLMSHARMVITDSGGLQEEACALQVPCVTLRENTERPETVTVGSNVLVGNDEQKILAGIEKMLSVERSWSCPYGDGISGKRIVDVLVGVKRKAEGSQVKNICVIGLGYMGLPMACILAEAGHTVSGFDIDRKKMAHLKEKKCPFDEIGMTDLLIRAVDSGRLQFFEEMPIADIYLISVPTPVKDQKCDLSMVISAFKNVLTVCKPNATIIIESTIKPGTCRDQLAPIALGIGKDIRIAHCPERAIPGNTIHELVHNDRIASGLDKETTTFVAELYRTFCKGTVWETDCTTAECVKLLENTFRDINIAAANEFDQVLKTLGVSSEEAISLANKHPRVNILKPGIGVGGHCIAVDPWFLIEGFPESKMIASARNINDTRPALVAQGLATIAKNRGGKIGILGIAYKPDVDDLRESPSVELIHNLEELGLEVQYHDPFVELTGRDGKSLADLVNWSNFLFIATEHSVFKEINVNIPVLRLKDLVFPRDQGVYN